jgi:trigger factor
MIYKRKNLSKSDIEISVEIDAADLTPARDSAVEKLSADLKVPGFRKGKAPRAVAEKYLNQQALNDEVVQAALSKTLIEILTKEQLQPLGKPNIKITKFVPFDQLEGTIEMTILPPIKLGGYMDLSAKKPELEVKDSDVDNVIENLRSQAAEKKVVKRAAAEGDEVVVDFVGSAGGVEFAGGRAEKVPLLLGSGQMIPGFEDDIVGHKTGVDFTIKVTFPKDYNAKDLAGRKAEFKTKLGQVSELKKPALDDKFATKVGPFYTVKELKEAIRKELQQKATLEATEQLKGELLAQLVKRSKVEIPQLLLDDQIGIMEREALDNMKYRGMSEADFLKRNGFATKEDWIQQELTPEAERRVKNGLVLAELAKQEKIEVSDAEIDERQKQIVDQYTDPELKKRFETPEVRRDIANRIATGKALDKLVAYNS